MNISIFGLGYVGCVSMGCLAANKYNIIGVDINKTKVDLINNGLPTIVEKDIDVLIKDGFDNGLIQATTEASHAVNSSDISIICSGTPSAPTGHLNLDTIFQIASDIGNALSAKNQFHVIVIRSTVFPGTNRKVIEIIEGSSQKQNNKDFAVVSNPEFLREGSAVSDYYNPALTVLGSENRRALDVMRKIYRFIDAPIVETKIEVAEIIKYVNNSYHALKITFANEIGNICKALNIDSHEVMKIFCMDDQLNISPYYFKPGFAYGGSCLPKDLKGLNTIAHDAYLKSPLIESIYKSNENQKELAFELVTKYSKHKIGILGLSFKKGTDDLRSSPSVDLAEKLLGKGYEIKIYDGVVRISDLSGTNKEYIESKIPHLVSLISDDLEMVVQSSDLIIITYKDEIFRPLLEKYPSKIVIDLVRIKDQISEGNYEGICW